MSDVTVTIRNSESLQLYRQHELEHTIPYALGYGVYRRNIQLYIPSESQSIDRRSVYVPS